jgi:predicted nucleic acid-binding protein
MTIVALDDVIASGDRDLLSLEWVGAILILTTAELLEQLERCP